MVHCWGHGKRTSTLATALALSALTACATPPPVVEPLPPSLYYTAHVEPNIVKMEVRVREYPHDELVLELPNAVDSRVYNVRAVADGATLEVHRERGRVSVQVGKAKDARLYYDLIEQRPCFEQNEEALDTPLTGPSLFYAPSDTLLPHPSTPAVFERVIVDINVPEGWSLTTPFGRASTEANSFAAVSQGTYLAGKWTVAKVSSPKLTLQVVLPPDVEVNQELIAALEEVLREANVPANTLTVWVPTVTWGQEAGVRHGTLVWPASINADGAAKSLQDWMVDQVYGGAEKDPDYASFLRAVRAYKTLRGGPREALHARLRELVAAAQLGASGPDKSAIEAGLAQGTAVDGPSLDERHLLLAWLLDLHCRLESDGAKSLDDVLTAVRDLPSEERNIGALWSAMESRSIPRQGALEAAFAGEGAPLEILERVGVLMARELKPQTRCGFTAAPQLDGGEVVQVEDGSAAARAGLETGDTVEDVQVRQDELHLRLRRGEQSIDVSFQCHSERESVELKEFTGLFDEYHSD